MKAKIYPSTVGSSVLALTAIVSVTAVDNAYAKTRQNSVSTTKAVIVEFGFVPGRTSSARLAHLATLSVSRELDRRAKDTESNSVSKSTTPELKSLYQVAGQPLPAAAKPRQSDLGAAGILKAARSQKADAIITGWITDVKFVGDGSEEHPRRAKVTISVQIIDVITEEMENGAIASGYSALPVGNAKLSDEEMLSQAVSDAAGKVALYIQSYRIPRPSVVSCTGKEVLLDCGEQDGMVLGQELAIIRNRKVTTRVRVTKIDDHKAWAVILSDSSDVQSGDETRGYFRLPS